MTAERARALVLLSTIVGASVVYIDTTAVNLALPVMQQEFSAGIDFLQWVIDSYLLFVAAPMLAAGALCDRFGAGWVYITGGAIFTVASILCGIADSGNMLIAARMLQGLGGGLLAPAALALIAAVYPANQLGRGIGIFVTASALTSLLGPLLGGWLIDNLSWRWIFFINPAITFASFVVLFSAGKLNVTRREVQLDITGALLVTIGLGMVVWGLIGTVKPDVQGFAVAAVSIGLFVLALFLLNEARLGDRAMMPVVYFRDPTFLGITLVTLIFYAGLLVFMFYAPLFLIQIWRFDAFTAGAASLPFVLMLSAASFISGRITDRFGARRPLIAGLTIATFGFSGFLMLNTEIRYLEIALPVYLVTGAGMGLLISPLTKIAINSLPDHLTGIASAINHTVSRIGGMIGIPISGLIVVSVFSRSLQEKLEELPISLSEQERMLSQSHNLMGIDFPINIQDTVRIDIEEALRGAFVDGFHGAIWVVVGGGIISVMLSWLLVDRK